MNKFWLTAWAVGISFLFLSHPFLALAVGAGLLVYLNRKSLVDTTVKAASALWIITIFAFSAQLLVGWVTTDLSLDALIKEFGLAGGVVGIWKNPVRIAPIVLGQMLVYLVAFGALVRLTQSEHQKRWAKWAILLGIAAVVHQGIDSYFPVRDEVSGAERGAITVLREAFHRRVAGKALEGSRRLDLNNAEGSARSKQPKRQYVIREEMMYGIDGHPVRMMGMEDSVMIDHSQPPIYFSDFPNALMYRSLYIDQFGVRKVGYLIPDCLGDEPTTMSLRRPTRRPRTWQVADLREVVVRQGVGWVPTGMVPDQGTLFQYEIRTPGVQFTHLWMRTGEGGEEAHPSPRRLDDGRVIGENAVTVYNVLGHGLQMKLSNDCPATEVTLGVTMQVSS